jgi:hypothetical protein
MLRTFLCSRAELRRSAPRTRPCQDFCVGTPSAGRVVLAGDVQGEVEKRLTARFEKGRESDVALGLELDRQKGLGAFVRDAISLLPLAQTSVEIPFPCRILSEVVYDVAVAANPQCPTFQRRQLI